MEVDPKGQAIKSLTSPLDAVTLSQEIASKPIPTTSQTAPVIERQESELILAEAMN